MGQCLSFAAGPDRREARQEQQHAPAACCEVQRLPAAVFLHILALLDQADLMQAVPLVCKAWHEASNQALQRLSLNLSSSTRQAQLPHMLAWMRHHGAQLQQLHLASSTPLGLASRRALLRTLCKQQHQHQQRGAARHPAGPPRPPLQDATASTSTSADASSSSSSGSGSTHSGGSSGRAHHSGSSAPPALQLRQLCLQMDLDVCDLAYLTHHVLAGAPRLEALKLQPLKPNMADLQLLVLACIVGNLIGADAPGPVLPQLPGASGAVAQLAASVTQLRSLSLARYDLGCTSCVARASQLTSLSLQHCGLGDASLAGLAPLTRLRRLELPDNALGAASLADVAELRQLTYLDLSAMPSVSRMRGAAAADLSPLSRLTNLASLNIIGFGAADATPLAALPRLSVLDAGLNPLSGASLRALGGIASLEHLELGGISQAWVLSSVLPPDMAIRSHQACWFGLSGLRCVTALDLGGSHFSHTVWVSHVCPLLGSMAQLRWLHLAHCSIPPNKLQYLLPLLNPGLVDLSIDRVSCVGDELTGLLHLTQLTRLSAASMHPKLCSRQALMLTQLTSLKHLVLRNNDVGARTAQALARALPALTCLDLADNPIGRRASKRLAHLNRGAEEAGLGADMDCRYW